MSIHENDALDEYIWKIDEMKMNQNISFVVFDIFGFIFFNLHFSEQQGLVGLKPSIIRKSNLHTNISENRKEEWEVKLFFYSLFL